MSTVQRDASLVVIEYGASWPRWLEPTRYAQLAVVAQHYEGEPSSLITQVASRLQRLERERWSLGTIMLVCNGRTDDAARTARSILARGLIAKLGAIRGAQLVLSSDSRRERSGLALSTLAASIESEARFAGVRLSLRLGSSEPVIGSIAALASSA